MATQYGTIKLRTGSGTVDVPVFNTGSSGSNVYEFLRVHTPSGTGYIPATNTSDAAHNYLRIHTESHGTLAIHDSAATLSISTDSTLDGEDVTLKVFEDTDGDGTAENEESFTLSGGSETFSPSNLALSSGNVVWWYLEADDSDVTNAAEISDVMVTGDSTKSWTNRNDFHGPQTVSGATYDRLGDHAADKLQHGYFYGSITKGLVSYWPLDSGSGSTATDDTELGNDGTITGATWNGSGQIGSDCLSFDGSDDLVKNSSVDANGSTVTVTGWFKLDGDQASFLQSGGSETSAPSDGWNIKLDSNTDFVVLHWSSGSSATSISATSDLVSTSSWVFYAVTFDGDDAKAWAFNSSGNQLSGSPKTGSGSRGTTSGQTFLLMQGESNSNAHAGGLADDIRVYDRLLSEREIEALANLTSPSTVTAGDTLQ